MEKILIVDDDVELCELVGRYLQREGFAVEYLHDGALGVRRVLEDPEHFAMLVLDVMLPSMNGFEVLRRIREKVDMPVLMLTARGEDTDRIVGLEIGADDYLSKPFNPRELAARMRAVLRRTGAAKSLLSPERLRAGDVELEPAARLARKDGKVVELTGAEFDLLTILIKNVGKVVPRDELVRRVLGRALTAYDRSIDTLVSNLRRKLGHESGSEGAQPGAGRIRAVRGNGYIYAVSARHPDGGNGSTPPRPHETSGESSPDLRSMANRTAC